MSSDTREALTDICKGVMFGLAGAVFVAAAVCMFFGDAIRFLLAA